MPDKTGCAIKMIMYCYAIYYTHGPSYLTKINGSVKSVMIIIDVFCVLQACELAG